MIIEPPGTRCEFPDRRQVILKCNIQDMSFLFSQLYNALLILVSTVYAVKTRRIPENFNESKFIGFTMYTTCIIWLAFVPIYFGTGNAHETQITTLCVAISLSASVTLVCLYSPKVYIIVFQPDKNIRGKVCMGSTFKKQGSSAGASSMTKCEDLRNVMFVKPGDRVSQFDEICEVQSDKASVTITSRYDGLVKALHFNVDDVAMVGAALLDIEIEDDPKDAAKNSEEVKEGDEDQAIDGSSDKKKKKKKKEETDETESQDKFAEKVLTTPAVRRIAMESNVKLKDVAATGKDGRVLKEDVLAHLRKMTSATAEVTENVTGRTVGLKGYSRHMWKTMTRSLSIPHFVYSDECNVDQAMRCRDEVKDSLRNEGVSLTLMPFFVKAASRALERCPELNAWLNEEERTLRILDNHNIGIAMDTPEGLVVPNIKNVQSLSVLAIARELNRLQELGRRSSIPLDDLADTTFSLSNIGVIGGTYTKPVILPPQVIIGAFGRAQKVPRFDDEGHVIPAHVMSISWSADHRVLDGVAVARFSNLWKHYVENPVRLLIGA
ncbi:lipoamide acyltransferase component of branched-chain alpha-keto acid dehydrogenase mitochondrial [Lasius niger]|uniref:Dihydrolipoamide acetyltransferase component of pyruvate dehydrogenase complex n=1 Tax=Lasius niger TaxID=67767 RepID=A0A0J7KM34_LASNI|nr:lipoamide acyltransferase component of branched-chain alpha-keto acid dehydrogenase mitochondrial [Lasius niger]